ncbi:hypothetical protein ACJX0J_021607, partial [Zea mays]
SLILMTNAAVIDISLRTGLLVQHEVLVDELRPADDFQGAAGEGSSSAVAEMTQIAV